MIKNITQTILLLFLIFLSLNAEAKRRDFPFVAVAGSADLIVIGEIYGVKGRSYTFKITETLKGQVYKVISVKMFDEWTCDMRFDKPKIGQKLCLFLRKRENFSWENTFGRKGELQFRKIVTDWEIINGSGGELQISNNLVHLGGDASIMVNHKITSNSISLVQFKNGIRDFCKCYQFIGEYGNWDKLPVGFIQICSDLQITNFKNKSKFSRWLFESMECSPQKIVPIDYNTVFKPYMFLW
ncbi:hypothetical protein [Flavobacterium sp. WC2509]|uniref:hypothetical protein n=1 Tax=Flavobacterium sp. WC2509 TaxID=3461406 RepID=UPI0040440A60